MSNLLDKSLDEIIKSNRTPSRSDNQSRGGGRGSGSGPLRRFTNRGGNRAAPYSRPVQAPESGWNLDVLSSDAVVFPAVVAGGASGLETGTKLYLSNLDYGVSNEDIKELFSEVGDLKRYGIHYDRSGRSKGTAEVVYSRRNDAFAAVKRYNNVQLDGKPMKVEIVGTNLSIQSAPPLAANVMYGNVYDGPRRGRGGFRGRPRGGFGAGAGATSGRGGRGGRGFGRGRDRGRDEKISPEDLDADLEKYHKEAMETN